MSLCQRLIRDVLYPIDVWRAGDAATLRYLKEFERTQFLPLEEIRTIQLERLRSLLEHSYRHCPFYKERWDRAGAAPQDLKTLDDIRAFPILEKQDIQENRDAMVAKGWLGEDLIPNQTGGSTGRPISFFLSHDRKCSRAAATIRHNRWASWDIGDKVAYIWGAPRDLPPRSGSWRGVLRNRLLAQQLFLDTAQFTEGALLEFHDALKRFRPKVILAYARGAVLLARYLRSRGLTPFQPFSIVTSAEVLEPEDRALLEETFGCPVFDRYGCREVSVLASECKCHQGLHTMAEGLLIEVVRQDGSAAAPGERGSILVADLLNQAMPLIRYRIGDLGAWSDGDCPCGRGLPRLRAVSGRVTDFLVGTDGRMVSGVFLATYVVAQRPSLGQVQILQDQAQSVLFRIQRGQQFRDPDDLDYLVERTRAYLGPMMRMEWEFVDELPPEPSGKYLFCRSSVTPQFLRSTTQLPKVAS